MRGGWGRYNDEIEEVINQAESSAYQQGCDRAPHLKYSNIGGHFWLPQSGKAVTASKG